MCHRHRSNPKSLNRQKGVVIVVALFIVAIVATMAYVMMTRAQRDTERTSLLLHATQAEFYAEGSIAWAKDQLKNDWETRKNNQIIDAIPLKSTTNEINNYTISSTIYDLQSRFNLNQLKDGNAQLAFKRLIQSVDPKLADANAQQIILAIVDWIAPTTQESEYSKYYMNLPEPYRAAHKPMLSESELQLVKGVTPELYAALQPNVIALPDSTLINVQTASPEVLMTLSPDMSLESAQAIDKIRKETPLVTTQAFAGLDIVKNHQITADKITVSSNYFLVETDVKIAQQHALIYTLLERATSGEKATTRIVWQSKSVW